jgi:hypothetical protein
MVNGNTYANFNMTCRNGVNFIKIVTAGQARIMKRYKNLKQKISKCKANIYFSKNNKNCVFEGNAYVNFNTLRHNGTKFIKKKNLLLLSLRK